MSTITYRELNLKFYDALNQIFQINKHKTWADLAKEITIEKISETYKIFGEIFPVSLDRYNMLPQNDPTEKLTSIFHGILDGETIIGNIARYSLYCDEIIVFHPLQNPHITQSKYNPIVNASLWKRTFINNLYFYIVIQKWVKAELVHLIENPFSFDFETRKILCDEAEKRLKRNPEIFEDIESTKELDEPMLEHLKKSFLGKNIEIIENTLKETHPTYTISQIKELAKELKQYEKTLPLYVDFGDANTDDIIVRGSGGNLEMVEALCRLTGAHSYSSQKIILKQLEVRGVNPFWTKFGALYSGLNLTYLDNADTNFALKIREEERIGGLRKVLRELSSFLEKTELDKISDDNILSFNEKFNHEVKKSEVEWMKILDDAQKVNATAIAGSTIAAIIDPTKIILPAITIPSTIVITEIYKKKGLKGYRAKDAYSVFVDLKNKKPTFTSDLKNCIF